MDATNLLPVLRRTLKQYKRYGQTKSVWLQELRDKWIPVEVEERFEARVCKAAVDVLEGRSPILGKLSKEHQIAVTMLVYQVWVDSVMADAPVHEKNVARWMIGVKKSHAMLALRNAAGGPETGGGPSGSSSPVSKKVRVHVVQDFKLWGDLYRGLRKKIWEAEAA